MQIYFLTLEDVLEIHADQIHLYGGRSGSGWALESPERKAEFSKCNSTKTLAKIYFTKKRRTYGFPL